MIDDGIKEIEYKETLHLDLEEKALFWISIKQFYVFETGIKKEAHVPVVYDELTPSNLVMLYDESENSISFGNAYVGNSDRQPGESRCFNPGRWNSKRIRGADFFIGAMLLYTCQQISIRAAAAAQPDVACGRVFTDCPGYR